jgi:hypothetical protein
MLTIAHVQGVVAYFQGHGLTLPAYLRAAARHPQLFYQAPATLIANIEQVARHFAPHGLTLPEYLGAAVRHPQLFYQAPATLVANIEEVARHFVPHGLALPDYLRAAVKQPPLFASKPATVIRHVHLVIDMHAQGLVTFPGQKDAPPDQPLGPLFAFLVKLPLYFCLADDNYALRIRYAQVTGDLPRGAGLLTRPRSRIERDLARALGQPHPSANA